MLDAADQLVELQGEQPAVGAELDDVTVDLAGDAADHLEPLSDRRDVANRDQVFDLEVGQGAGDLVETQLVALEGGQRLVGPGQDRGGVLEHVAAAGDVQSDDVHRLAHRDHRVARSAWPLARRSGAGCPSLRRRCWGQASCAPPPDGWCCPQSPR